MLAGLKSLLRYITYVGFVLLAKKGRTKAGLLTEPDQLVSEVIAPSELFGLFSLFGDFVLWSFVLWRHGAEEGRI